MEGLVGLDGACSPPPVPQLGKKVAWGPTEVKFVSPLPPSAYFLSPTPTSLATRPAFDEQGYFITQPDDLSSESSVSLSFPMLSSVAFGETIKFSDMMAEPAMIAQSATVEYDFGDELMESARRDDEAPALEQGRRDQGEAPTSFPELIQAIHSSTQRARETANAVARTQLTAASSVSIGKEPLVNGAEVARAVRRIAPRPAARPASAAVHDSSFVLPSARRALLRQQHRGPPPVGPPPVMTAAAQTSSGYQAGPSKSSQAARSTGSTASTALSSTLARKASVSWTGNKAAVRQTTSMRSAGHTLSGLATGRTQGKGMKLFAQLEEEGRHGSLPSFEPTLQGPAVPVEGNAQPASQRSPSQPELVVVQSNPAPADSLALQVVLSPARETSPSSVPPQSRSSKEAVEGTAPAARSKTRAAIEELKSVVTALREGQLMSPVRHATLTAMVTSDSNLKESSSPLSPAKQETASGLQSNDVGSTRSAPPDANGPGSPAAKLFRRANVVLRVAAGQGSTAEQDTSDVTAEAAHGSSPVRAASPKQAHKALSASRSTPLVNGKPLRDNLPARNRGPTSRVQTPAKAEQVKSGVPSSNAAVTVEDALEGQRSAHGPGRRLRSAAGTPLPSSIRRPRSDSAFRSPPPVLPGPALARVALPPVVISSASSSVRHGKLGAGGRYSSVRRASAGSVGSGAVNNSTLSGASISQALTFSEFRGDRDAGPRTAVAAVPSATATSEHALGHRSGRDPNTAFADAVAAALEHAGGEQSAVENMTVGELLGLHRLHHEVSHGSVAVSSPPRTAVLQPGAVDSPFGSFPVVHEASLGAIHRGEVQHPAVAEVRSGSPSRPSAVRTGGGYRLPQADGGRSSSPPRDRHLQPGSLPVPVTELLPMLAASLDAPVASALAAVLPAQRNEENGSQGPAVRPLSSGPALPDSITAAMRGELHPAIVDDLSDRNTSFSTAVAWGSKTGHATSHLLQISRHASIPGAITGFLTAAGRDEGPSAAGGGPVAVEIPAGPITAETLVGAAPVLRGRGVASVYSVRPAVRPLGSKRYSSATPSGAPIAGAGDGGSTDEAHRISSILQSSKRLGKEDGDSSTADVHRMGHILQPGTLVGKEDDDSSKPEHVTSPKVSTASTTGLGSQRKTGSGDQASKGSAVLDGENEAERNAIVSSSAPANVQANADGDGSSTALLGIDLITAADCYGDEAEAARRNAELRAALARMRGGQTASPVRNLPLTATVSVPTGTGSRVDAGGPAKAPHSGDVTAPRAATSSIAGMRRASAATPGQPTALRTLKSAARSIGLASRLGSSSVRAGLEPPAGTVSTPGTLMRQPSKQDVLSSSAAPTKAAALAHKPESSSQPALKQAPAAEAKSSRVAITQAARSTEAVVDVSRRPGPAGDHDISVSLPPSAKPSPMQSLPAPGSASSTVSAEQPVVAADAVPHSAELKGTGTQQAVQSANRPSTSAPVRPGASSGPRRPTDSDAKVVPPTVRKDIEAHRRPEPTKATSAAVSSLTSTHIHNQTVVQRQSRPEVDVAGTKRSSNPLSADASARETIRAILAHQSKGAGRRGSVTDATDKAASLRRRGSIVLDSAAALHESIFSDFGHATSTYAATGHAPIAQAPATTAAFPYPIEIKDGRAYALVPLTAPQLPPPVPVAFAPTPARRMSSSSTPGIRHRPGAPNPSVPLSGTRPQPGAVHAIAAPLPYMVWPQQQGVYATPQAWSTTPTQATPVARVPTIAGQRRLSTASSQASVQSRASSHTVPHVGAATLPGPMSPTTKLVHRLLGALARSPDVHRRETGGRTRTGGVFGR